MTEHYVKNRRGQVVRQAKNVAADPAEIVQFQPKKGE